MADLYFLAATRYANAMEVVQTVAAFCGLIFSSWAFYDALKDSMALGMSGVNGTRRIIATGNVLGEMERVIIHSILFLVGLLSIFLPPPFPPGDLLSLSPELLQHTLTRFGLIAITLIKVNGALRARRERIRFIRQMRLDGYPKQTTSAQLAPPPGQCRRAGEHE